MFFELSSPKNESIQKLLDALLTPPLAKLLRNKDPGELLYALNENVERCNKIWNVNMRKELLDFVTKLDVQRGGRYIEGVDAAVESFFFSSLQDEIIIGGVYVRVFVRLADLNEIDDPSVFCSHVISYLHERTASLANPLDSEMLQSISESIPTVVIDALRILVANKHYIAKDIVDSPHGIEVIYLLVDPRFESSLVEPVAQLLKKLHTDSEFVQAATKQYPDCCWRLIRFICMSNNAGSADVWLATDAFISHYEGLGAFIDAHGILYLLGIIFGSLNYCHIHSNRLRAIGLLCRLLWTPIKGAEAAAMLRRFIPEPIIRQLKSKTGDATLKALDSVCETPELFWSTLMRQELRTAIHFFLSPPGDLYESFRTPIQLPDDYNVNYQQLSDEIYIGGVYIRLYLKQRTYRLSNPVYFLEQLIVVWEGAFSSQVPDPNVANDVFESNEGHRELILGKEDFLSLLTSCVVCLISNEADLADHLDSWGLNHRLFTFLHRAVSAGKKGVPALCILRILKELIGGRESLYNAVMNSGESVIRLLLESMKSSPSFPLGLVVLQKEAVLSAEILKIMFQTATCPLLDQLVKEAIEADLPAFFLDHILDASLLSVRNPSALRIYAMEVLKLMCESEVYSGYLRPLLESHKAWKKYKSQSLDLYLTVIEILTELKVLRANL